MRYTWLDIYYELPIEMKNLKNLRVFLMEDGESNLEIIPLEVIESLEQLRVFRFSELGDTNVGFNREESFLEKLESLPKLEELCIQLTTITGMRRLLGSNKLLGCSRHFKLSLYVSNPLEMPSLLESLSRMKHLDNITLYRVKNIMEGSYESHFRKLHQVNIWDCDSITHLTWLRYALFLECLDVYFCDSIEHIVMEVKDGGSDDDIFLNLRHLRLRYLAKLKSIDKRALVLPSLKYICVAGCPKLRKLPINSSSAVKDKLISIYGETRWWDDLQWEDMSIATIRLLRSKLQPPFFI